MSATIVGPLLHDDPLEDFILLVPEWYDDAACQGVDTELFYPEVGGSSGATRALCDACPVRAECLQVALDNDLPGIWGGTSTNQRRLLRRAAA